MTNLLYYNLNELDDSRIDSYLNLLPEFMKQEIMGYKRLSDQKSKLVFRLMLQHAIFESKLSVSLEDWKRLSNNKPIVEGWYPFNASHSGDIVVFAYDEKDVGVDIEKKIELDYHELIHFFTPTNNNTYFHLSIRKKRFMKYL